MCLLDFSISYVICLFKAVIPFSFSFFLFVYLFVFRLTIGGMYLYILHSGIFLLYNFQMFLLLAFGVLVSFNVQSLFFFLYSVCPNPPIGAGAV